MKSFLAVIIIALLGFPGLAQEKPNVLLICIDDLKDWVGYLDGYEGTVHTPNIDRLASEGIAFTNAHTTSPVCNPSRTSFLLGKRPSTTGVYDNLQWWKPAYPDEKPLPQYFRENGYLTVGSGKVFHEIPGFNPPCSWDEYSDYVTDMPWNQANWDVERYAIIYGYRGPIVPYPDYLPLNGIKPLRSPRDWGALPNKPEDEYGDFMAAQYGVDFLEKDHEDPFFLAVGVFHPHLPWYVPQKYLDMYPIEDIVLPDIGKNDVEDLPTVGKEFAARYRKDFEEVRDAGKWKEAIQAYLASTTFADAQVGRLLDALENSQYAENTIVVLWSDHGWHLGSKEHWHKMTLWEESTRIPFVMKVPGMRSNGSECSAPVDMIHVYPTLLSLCDLPTKDDLDGLDMTPLLNNPESTWETPAIMELYRGNVAVRSEEWRYIRYHDGGEELYNLKRDPQEFKNLAGDKKYQTILEDHKKWATNDWKEDVPTKSDYFFDPYQCTWLEKETKRYIEGSK